jgi:hypothetical protein
MDVSLFPLFFESITTNTTRQQMNQLIAPERCSMKEQRTKMMRPPDLINSRTV